ncbi:PBP1A family penicillin-binding protein [Candidatus Daviesbacteria bacterium]|nr:PBP1A family penicillin-binding protein [Candidatus Daviesbacteria bacterium]
MKIYLQAQKGIISLILLGIVSFLAFIPILTYLYFAQDITTKDRIMNRSNTGVVLLDRHNQPFFKFYQARTSDYVPLDKIPMQLRQTIIVGEDKDFYKHPGFSLKAIAGAILADVKKGKLAYGGSTITQQLVKNSLLSSKKNFLRKYQEIILASEIERRFTKDEILEMYLNSAYFGEGAFGVSDASRVYFGKNVERLNLAEVSLLSAMLPAPSKYSPFNGNIDALKNRQSYVLDEMVEEGYINKAERVQAENLTLTFNGDKELFDYKAPHFALFVKALLEKEYGEEKIARSGYKITTTLDLPKQEFAETVVATQVARLSANRVSNGAAVVLNTKTGEILAMVGSYNWNDKKFGKLNIVTTPRQSGSAFKPVVYSKALEEGIITPGTILQDKPQTFPATGDYNSFDYKECLRNGGKGFGCYSPKNYDGRFRGQVFPRRALANSLNVPSVEVMSKVGVYQAISQAQKLGITTLKDPSSYGLSLVLGAGEVKLLELASAYSVFGNQGNLVEPAAILEIKDKYDKTIYSYKPKPKLVLSKEVAFLISLFLSDAKARAEIFGNALNTGVQAAVKTGTTENYKDALTLGYTDEFTVGVWVGNNDNVSMDQIAGSLGAAPIFKSLIEKFSEGKPPVNFEPPPGVIKISICKENGFRLKGEATSSAFFEYFIKGSEPTRYCVIQKPIPPPADKKDQTPTSIPQIIEISKEDMEIIIKTEERFEKRNKLPRA